MEKEMGKMVAFYQWWADYMHLTSTLYSIGEGVKEDGFMDMTLSLMLTFISEKIEKETFHTVAVWFCKDEHWRKVDPEAMAYWTLNFAECPTYEAAELAIEDIDGGLLN